MTSSVMDAFKSLNVSSAQDLSDHETIFEVSYQYLSKVKDYKDLGSFHNCIVSLINCDKYHRAYQLIHEVPSETHDQFPLEKAYVYYKIGHVDELEAVYHAASNCSDVTLRALKHVLAQTYYQHGRIHESLSLYRELISSNTLDNELDLACNERAILSQSGASTTETLVQVAESDKNYDLVFNEALIKLAQGDVSSSLDLLEKASQMCLDHSMDSDPADLLLELAPIKLSIAYAHQVSGNPKLALQVMEDIDISAISDFMINLIFKNNMASLLPQDDNLNFLSRELNLQRNLQHLRQKLTRAQYQLLFKNHLLLSYQSKSLSKTSNYFTNQFYRQYSETQPGDVTPLIYKILVKLDITLEDLHSSTKAKTVARKILKFALAQLEEKPSDYSVAAALLLVHVNAKSYKFDQSILVLEKLTALELEGDAENLHASTFGTLMNLYEIENGSKKLTALYASLVAKFESLSAEALRSSPQLYEFVRVVYFKLLASDQAPSSLLQKLSQANPEDVIVSSTLKGDSSSLSSAEQLASKTDVEELLDVNVEELVEQKPKSASTVASRKNAYKVSKKPRKPQFSKTKVLKDEKDFDADKLDKERWLPMKLRSYYKPSKKELKKKSGGLQGAVESSPAPSNTPRASSSSKSKQQQKKKKKGKK